MTVFVTSGGRRFHADRACWALANGRGTQAYFAGEGLHGESWYGAGSLPGMYPVAAVPIEALPRARYTACRVCVPPALALPATGDTYGHEPVRRDYGAWTGEQIVCARCTEFLPRFLPRPRRRHSSVRWPCTSAVVLGLVIADADRWNAAYPVGTPVTAYPLTRVDKPLLTRTRTPAWRLGHGGSVVSVDGYAGGICLTHIDPRGGA